jgi:hypothetical protein
MKRNILLAAMMLTAGSLLAADPKDDVTAATKKLADADNYSWKSTTENAGGGQGGFTPGPTTGQANKDGWVYTKSSFNDQEFEMAWKGTNGAMSRGDGWQTFAEMAQGAGGRRGGGFGRGGAPVPATQVMDILKQVKEVKQSGGDYVADLTEDGAKAQLTGGFGGGRGGGAGAQVENAKGSVRFTIKDGTLSKYVLKVSGKRTFNDQDFDIDRTTTVEFKDVGTTKMTIPDEAKKKLS